MPKKAKELSAREVSRIRKPGSHAVGGVSGLILRVSDAGARSWVLRVAMGTRVNGKGLTVPRRRDIGLGGYPDVTLAMARDKAREARGLIERGIDPIEEKKAIKRALQNKLDNYLAFGDAARQCHEIKKAEFTNKKHAAQWITTLERYAFPVLEHLPVEAIETHHVEKLLKPIWHEKTETATRVRRRVEAVLRWAYTKRKIDRQNPARWEGNLKELLPAPAKIQKRRHFTALPYSEMPGFMARLRAKGGIGARALEFTILTAARSGEIRGATWDEIDLQEALWRIPGERMKAGRAHAVPLSTGALRILRETPERAREGLIFTAPRGGALSDMTLAKVLRDMKVDAVPHGMRSTFKTWAQEKTRYPDEASELALAHVNSDATRAAYARSELIDIRRQLMRDWSEFCDGIESTVVSMHERISS